MNCKYYQDHYNAKEVCGACLEIKLNELQKLLLDLKKQLNNIEENSIEKIAD